MEEEFIPLCQSPSFILAGQRLPKSSHVLEQMIGQKPNAWSAGKRGAVGGGAPETEGPVKVLVGREVLEAEKQQIVRRLCSVHKKQPLYFFFCFAPCKPK